MSEDRISIQIPANLVQALLQNSDDEIEYLTDDQEGGHEPVVKGWRSLRTQLEFRVRCKEQVDDAKNIIQHLKLLGKHDTTGFGMRAVLSASMLQSAISAAESIIENSARPGSLDQAMALVHEERSRSIQLLDEAKVL